MKKGDPSFANSHEGFGSADKGIQDLRIGGWGLQDVEFNACWIRVPLTSSFSLSNEEDGYFLMQYGDVNMPRNYNLTPCSGLQCPHTKYYSRSLKGLECRARNSLRT